MFYDLAEEGTRKMIPTESMLTADSGRRGKAMQAMGAINKHYGSDYLAARPGNKQNAEWRMRRGRMSPYYTTKLSDLPKVKAGKRRQEPPLMYMILHNL